MSGSQIDYSDSEIINLQDAYTLFYGFLAQSIYGLPNGEDILRKAIRRYGQDRGLTMRAKHEVLGVKINMRSLFSVAPDLPSDPRFKRERQEFNDRVYNSHALVCPMAEVWDQHDMRKFGRIYCEEFHFACYNSYGFNQTRVEMTHTITQEGDEICVGLNELNPESLPDSLKAKAFKEYDPTYQEPVFTPPPPNPKVGFATLCLKIYYYLLDCALEIAGESGLTAIRTGLINAASDVLARLSDQTSMANFASFLERNNPIPCPELETTFWHQYPHYNAHEVLAETYYENLRQYFKL